MNRPSVADHPDEAMRRCPPAAYRRGIATAAGHHAVVQTELDGFAAYTLTSPSQGGVAATFVPGAGMLGASLRHRGEELLGLRRGLRAYVERRMTMGIPLLHPWANRVSERRFEVQGREVVLDPDAVGLRLDPAGLPMHGLLAAASGWEVERHDASPDGALLRARFDFAAHPSLLAAFPFAHEVAYEATLRGATLEIALTVDATADVAVPIAFGFHPYLRLPVPRRDWYVEIPVREALVLDERMLPTGERRATTVLPGLLGERTFDHAFAAPPGGAPFVLAGGDRRIEVALDEAYRFAQVYAPGDDDVIAFEPMIAPGDALVAGGRDLPLLAQGERFRASFSVTVADD